MDCRRLLRTVLQKCVNVRGKTMKEKLGIGAPARAGSLDSGAARYQHCRGKTSPIDHGWSAQSDHLEQIHRVKRIWRNLGLLLPGVVLPTRAEIEADKYDGSVTISQWLAHTPSS